EFLIGKMVLGLAIMSSQYWAPHTKLAPFLRALQLQVDEFIAGFTQELDFAEEARNHERFFLRSLRSKSWSVPRLYGSTSRIIEMEYLSDATSLAKALGRLPRRERRRFQSQVAQQLLYTVLSHIFMYQEMHGDLHPGNIMIGADGALHLIDWGNVVPLEGKWGAVWEYLTGAITADLDLLTDALIQVSTTPDENRARRDEIHAALAETLKKKGVTPLTRRNFLLELKRGGVAGLHTRGQTILHLMSNTQHAGVVIKKEYLHLSRALMAAAGSFGTLYEKSPKRLLMLDLAFGLARLPWKLARDITFAEVSFWRARMARLLPLPKVLRDRLAPPSVLALQQIQA